LILISFFGKLVPNHIVGESEMEASREGRSLADFKYACVGYSVYSDGKDPSIETKAELPVCVGLEVIIKASVSPLYICILVLSIC